MEQGMYETLPLSSLTTIRMRYNIGVSIKSDSDAD